MIKKTTTEQPLAYCLDVIWKFNIQLAPGRLQNISAPEKSIFVKSNLSHEKISIWMICDPNQPLSNYWYTVIGTGIKLSSLRFYND